jgi:hypothetical protein
MQTFEDVVIFHEGSHSCPSFNKALAERLRYKQVRSTLIQWIAAPYTPFILQNHGTVVKKKGSDSWEKPLLSNQELTDPITYSQFKTLKLGKSMGKHSGSGVFVGVSQSNKIETRDFTRSDKTICMYNDVVALDSGSVTRITTFCKTGSGDVIGVLVDQHKDQILFYINGKLSSVGKRKPSEMRPLYAVLWLYYNECHIEMGNFYDYTTLEPYDGDINPSNDDEW